MKDTCFFPSRAVQDAALTLFARRLLLVLCVQYSPQDVFTVAQVDIEQLIRYSSATFRSSRSELVAAGYLISACHVSSRYPCYHFNEEPTLELNRDICTQLLALESSRTALAVFLFLYSRLSAGQTEQSVAEISECTAISHHTVFKMLKILSDAGLIHIEQQRDARGLLMANRYSIPGAVTANYII